MPYIRIMKDGSKKTYYTEEEFFDIFDRKIKESADELFFEMREMRKSKEKFIRKEIRLNQLQYA